jgi:hypothetical protein
MTPESGTGDDPSDFATQTRLLSYFAAPAGWDHRRILFTFLGRDVQLLVGRKRLGASWNGTVRRKVFGSLRSVWGLKRSANY